MDHSAAGKIAVIGALGSTVLSDWYSGTLQHEVSIAAGLSGRYGEVVAETALDLPLRARPQAGVVRAEPVRRVGVDDTLSSGPSPL